MNSSRYAYCLLITFTLLTSLIESRSQEAGEWIDSATAKEVLPYAQMSQDAYNEKEGKFSLSDWKRIEDWEGVFKRAGLSQNIQSIKNSGFFAAIYRNQTTGELAIAYQGTRGFTDVKGLVTDVGAQAGIVPAQYVYAKDLAFLVKSQNPKAQISVTGHSKGGGEAAYVAQHVPGITKVITFNAAGPPFLKARTDLNQINVAVPGELVGDPNTKSFLGPANLPGKLYYVHSSTDLAQKANSSKGPNPIGDAKAVFSSDFSRAHQLPGMIGGLSAAAVGGIVPTSTTSKQAGLPSIGSVPATVGAPSLPFTRSAPGGISLSKAAAERMPLNLTLDGSYYSNGRIVLMGKPDSTHGIDAALFLTSLRLACESSDPYFSLDPVNGPAWSKEGEEATAAFWSRIEADFKTAPNIRQKDSEFSIRTVSARRDYAQIWDSMEKNYPNLKSKLVFQPTWLKDTRFGEILYRADVLLKELSGGVPTLEPGPVRAAKIDRYVSSVHRFTAQGLLASYEGRRDSDKPIW